jgi:hypothetical protein
MTEKVIVELVDVMKADHESCGSCCFCGCCAGDRVMAGIKREDGYYDPVCEECLKDSASIDARVREYVVRTRQAAVSTMESLMELAALAEEKAGLLDRLVFPSYEAWEAANEAAR